MNRPRSSPEIELRSAPHLRQGPAVPDIMRNVVWALLPVCLFAVYAFGLSALALIAVVTGACLLTEHGLARAAGGTSPLGDWSAVITGLLLALTLPPGFPLWMGAVAGVVAIGLGKALFGGLGLNVFNPALVGRAFVQAAFPVSITTWTPAFAPGRFAELIPSSLAPPFLRPPPVAEWSRQAVDGFTGATPLALQKFQHTGTEPLELLAGMTAGSVGETCAALIVVCGAYLALRRMMDWRIPVAVLGSAALAAGGLHGLDSGAYPDPRFVLLSGGLMLGAVFMATDMVGSPVTPLGVWIYGALIGVVTVIIRQFGGLPEGVMYAILLGNAASPLIDAATQPRVYGARGRGSAP